MILATFKPNQCEIFHNLCIKRSEIGHILYYRGGAFIWTHPVPILTIYLFMAGQSRVIYTNIYVFRILKNWYIYFQNISKENDDVGVISNLLRQMKAFYTFMFLKNLLNYNHACYIVQTFLWRPDTFLLLHMRPWNFRHFLHQREFAN